MKLKNPSLQQTLHVHHSYGHVMHQSKASSSIHDKSLNKRSQDHSHARLNQERSCQRQDATYLYKNHNHLLHKRGGRQCFLHTETTLVMPPLTSSNSGAKLAHSYMLTLPLSPSPLRGDRPSSGRQCRRNPLDGRHAPAYSRNRILVNLGNLRRHLKANSERQSSRTVFF